MRFARLSTLLILPAAVAAVAALTLDARAYEEPEVVNPSWSLDYKLGELKTISHRDARGHVRWYWYLPYEVTNYTGEPRMFVPELDLADDRGRVIAAGRDVPPGVFEAIVDQENNDLLLRPDKAIGTLFVGPDNRKESVGIWPIPDEDIDRLSIFFAGLHGETKKVEHPGTGEPVLMSRTVMIDYATPGTPTSPQNMAVKKMGQRDIMR